MPLLVRQAVLVRALLVDRVEVELVEEDEEDEVVTKARNAVGGGHGDEEGEDVVDERVEELVAHDAPWHVGH